MFDQPEPEVLAGGIINKVRGIDSLAIHYLDTASNGAVMRITRLVGSIGLRIYRVALLQSFSRITIS
jgi:hypothetical protein